MNPLAWLYARQGQVKPGLERIQALLARLGNPQEAYPVALIGGTNGKGTTARALAAILEEMGLRWGFTPAPTWWTFGSAWPSGAGLFRRRGFLPF